MNTKTQTRLRLIQAISQWLLTKEQPNEIQLQFIDKTKAQDNISKTYFKKVFIPLIDNLDNIKLKINQFTTKDITNSGLTEQAVLYLAVYEISNFLEIPYKIIINEAVELVKIMGTENSFKFINAVLDKIAKQNRSDEYKNKEFPDSSVGRAEDC